MRRVSLLAAVAGVLISGTGAIRLVERDVPAVVGLDIQRRFVSDPVGRDLQRRQSSKTVTEVLDNEETLYFANVSIGTPAQQLRLHIDTGSSDLWINAKTSRLCEHKGNLCAQSGAYDANSSSSYQFVSSDFNISYVDGSGALGDYVKDKLQIGGQTLNGFQFGVGYASTSPQGVLGIGYTVNEVQVNRNQQQAYPNLPLAMKNNGLIQSNAYSLWLNDLEANTGSILFGGVNTGKYHGSLQTLPIQPEVGVFAEFIIALTDMGLGSGGSTHSFGSSGLPAPALLDSGSSLSYLPDQIASNIFSMVQAQFDQNSGAAYVPCSLANNASTIDFTFTSPKISVPMNELVINPGTNVDGSAITFPDGTPACIFGIAPAGGSTPVLGDTFIRSAYVVYDLANNEISLAQTNFNSTEDHVVEIGTGKNSVPDATGVANPATVTAGSGGARIGGAPSGSFTLTGSFPTSTAKGAAIQKQVPLAMVAGAGLLALAGL